MDFLLIFKLGGEHLITKNFIYFHFCIIVLPTINFTIPFRLSHQFVFIIRSDKLINFCGVNAYTYRLKTVLNNSDRLSFLGKH